MKRILFAIAISLFVSSAYADGAVFGDSISVCYGIPQNECWVDLLAAEKGVTITNYSQNGSQVPDRTSDVYNAPAVDWPIVALGANDERRWDTDNARGKEYYRSGLQALIGWLAISDKKTARDDAVLTGSWTNTVAYGVGKRSIVKNSKATFTVQGRYIYVATISQDSVTGRFSLSIDGEKIGDFPAKNNAGTTVKYDIGYGPRLWRFDTGSADDATHTVQLKVTSPSGDRNYVYIDWVAGSYQSVKPDVWVANTIRQTLSGYEAHGGSDWNVQRYNEEVAEIVEQFQNDGFNVNLIDFYSVLDPATGLQPDGIHGNAQGNIALKDAAAAALP